MNRTSFFIAFVIASTFGVLSVLLTHGSDIGAAALFLIPGEIIATGVSGNIHDFAIWPCVVGNFTFYFGLVCLIWKVRDRFVSKPE